MTTREKDVQGQAATHGGRFTAEPGTDAAIQLIKNEGRALGVSPYWENGGQSTSAVITDAEPVDSRPNNYRVQLNAWGEDGTGYITVNPFEFGIESPDPHATNDRDRLYAGISNDGFLALQAQYSAAVDAEWFEGAFEDVDDNARKAIEQEIVTRIHDELGENVDVEFTSSDTWDGVEVLYNASYTPAVEGSLVTADADGNLTFETSSLMAAIESDDVYARVRRGDGEDIIFQTVQKHGINLR